MNELTERLARVNILHRYRPFGKHPRKLTRRR
jgi:hypothetical protein